MPPTDLLALPVAIVVAAVAWRAHALDRSGAIAATMVGATIVIGGGWEWGALLVLYFVSASALSRLPGRSAGAISARGSRRDAVQVLANGGAPTVLAAIHLFDPRALWTTLFVAALAGAAADTFATEIGSRYGGTPRAIIGFQSVKRGVSGGITAAGLGASLGAALLIAIAGRGLIGPEIGIATIVVAGFTTSVIDSVAGASIQAGYRCPMCRVSTERPVHRCGADAVLVRGRAWIDNDVVNLGSIVAGVAVAALLITR
jgi:uncharacterized protein (TIGR00297 family)